jgi:hypothetical protein
LIMKIVWLTVWLGADRAVTPGRISSLSL